MAKTITRAEGSLFGAFKDLKPEEPEEAEVKKETPKAKKNVEKEVEVKKVKEQPLKEKKKQTETPAPKKASKQASVMDENSEEAMELNMNKVVLPNKKAIEKKSVQKTILIKPSHVDKIMAYAEASGISFNDFVCRMIDALPEF